MRTIGGFGFHGADLLAQSQGTTKVAPRKGVDIAPVYRSQPAPTVVHDLGKLQRLRQGGAHLLAAAEGMQVSVAKREIQVHVAAWIRGHLASEAGNGLLRSPATFAH